MMNILTFFSKRSRAYMSIDPERDWIITLIISAILLISLVVWNVWAFDTVANGGVIGSPATNVKPVFNQASLDAIHTIFTNRADEEQKYVSGTYSFIDPSL